MEQKNHSTFVDVNDIRMLHGAHDLHLTTDAHQIGVRFDFALFDGFDGHFLAGFLVDAELHFAVCALAQFFDNVEPVYVFWYELKFE